MSVAVLNGALHLSLEGIPCYRVPSPCGYVTGIITAYLHPISPKFELSFPADSFLMCCTIQ